MEIFSAGPLWGEFTAHREFPSQRIGTRSFDAFFDLCLHKRLSRQSRRRWFETPSGSLYRHCNDAFSHCLSNIISTFRTPISARIKMLDIYSVTVKCKRKPSCFIAPAFIMMQMPWWIIQRVFLWKIAIDKGGIDLVPARFWPYIASKIFNIIL